jgi:hypothetical protein
LDLSRERLLRCQGYSFLFKLLLLLLWQRRPTQEGKIQIPSWPRPFATQYQYQYQTSSCFCPNYEFYLTGAPCPNILIFIRHHGSLRAPSCPNIRGSRASTKRSKAEPQSYSFCWRCPQRSMERELKSYESTEAIQS